MKNFISYIEPVKTTISEPESRFGIQQLRQYDGEFTCAKEAGGWLKSNRRWKKINTLEQLESEMQQDAYFKPRHFRKVDQAIAHLQDRGMEFTGS